MTRLRKVRRLALAVVLTLVTSTAVWGASEKLSAELKSRGHQTNVDVIVLYRVTPTAEHHRAIERLGGQVHAKMDSVKSAHYTIPASSLDAIAEDPDVVFVANRPLAGMMDIPAATVNAAAALTAGYTGGGIGVAVIDSGMADIPNFHSQNSRIVYQASFVSGSPVDQFGHGTHVAGLIWSNGNGSVYTGIVPNVNLINLRALDQNGNGTDASVINAINAAIQLKNQYNIRVINLSLGRPVSEPATLDPLCQAVEAAWRGGGHRGGRSGRQPGAQQFIGQ